MHQWTNQDWDWPVTRTTCTSFQWWNFFLLEDPENCSLGENVELNNFFYYDEINNFALNKN